METWPTLLPAPTSAYDIKLNASKLRTQMDSGRYRQRQRFGRENRLISVAWEFDDNEYEFFQSFYLYKLEGGVDFFNVTIPLGGGMRSFVARFADDPDAKYMDVLNWTVSSTLEVEDARVLSEADFDTLVGIGSLATLPSYLT